MGVTRERWQEYRRTKDPGLRELLITANIAFVRQVAGRLALHLPPHVELGELESAGIIGLLSAVESYDPDNTAEFATFAQHRIRGAILDELRSRDLAPRSLRAKAREIERALVELERANGRQPTDDEVADALGMDREAYYHQLGEIRGLVMVSLDEPAGDTDGSQTGRSHLELPDQELQDPFMAAATNERVKLLGEIIELLPDQERQVLTLYYYEELTMKEIGQVLRVTESRVSQIHTSAILRMRARLLRTKLQREDLRLDDRATFTARELVLAILLSVGWALAGCEAKHAAPIAPSVIMLRQSPVVVIPAPSSTEDRPLADGVARLFVLELSGSGMDVRGLDWLREEARSRGWDARLGPLTEWMAELREGAERSGPALGRVEGIDWQALGVSRVLIVGVFGVEQHWEGTARVTRVGVEARLIAVPTGEPLWVGRIAPASAGTTGWSFEYAARAAVRKLAESLR